MPAARLRRVPAVRERPVARGRRRWRVASPTLQSTLLSSGDIEACDYFTTPLDPHAVGEPNDQSVITTTFALWKETAKSVVKSGMNTEIPLTRPDRCVSQRVHTGSTGCCDRVKDEVCQATARSAHHPPMGFLSHATRPRCVRDDEHTWTHGHDTTTPQYQPTDALARAGALSCPGHHDTPVGPGCNAHCTGVLRMLVAHQQSALEPRSTLSPTPSTRR